MVGKERELATPTISDQLREFIANSHLSRYAISKASEVDQSQLHRFVNGTGRLTTDSLDRIATALGLRLVQTDNLDEATKPRSTR